MGGGTYCSTTRSVRADSLGYSTKSASAIFKQRNINNAMNPNGISIRESRDSAEHPNSLAIVLALDVTGSMGSIPHHLIKEGLPKVMDGMLQHGVSDPQVLFLGIGDHEWDNSPLQVGQFESSDELLDKWLTDLYIEGGGGGNAGESYLLAWYFGAKHTSIDCFEKRNQKGFLFTIGDEPTLKSFPVSAQRQIMGNGQYGDETAAMLLDAAREKYNVFHIHVAQGSNGRSQSTMNGWKELMGDSLIIADDHREIPNIIAKAIRENVNTVVNSSAKPSTKTNSESSKTEEEVML